MLLFVLQRGKGPLKPKQRTSETQLTATQNHIRTSHTFKILRNNLEKKERKKKSPDHK